MNKRFLVLAGVATVLSVGTFVVLNKVKPYKQEEPKVADVTTPDQVFGASVASPEAHSANEAATPAAAPAPADETAAAVQPADTAVQPAGSAAASPAPTTETAAAPAAGTGGGSVAPLVPTGPAGAAPATTSTETAAAAPAAEPATAEPTPAPAPAAEPAAPAPEPAAAPVEKPKKAAKNPAHAAYKAPKSASPKVWWPAENDSKLSLVYAGPASFKKAVVLMFNGAFFKDDSVKSNIKLTDKAGKAVAGSWEIGENNRRMLVFPVPAAGTYKVTIASGLTDSKGRKVGTKLSGPVVVH